MTASADMHNTGRILARQVFPASAKALATMRAFVEKWGTKVGLTEEQLFGMKLAVSEAGTNVIDHQDAPSDLTLWAWDQGDKFTVDVWHSGEFRVSTRRSRPRRGMGLPLMVSGVDEVSFACMPEGGVRVSFSVFLKDLKDAPEEAGHPSNHTPTAPAE